MEKFICRSLRELVFLCILVQMYRDPDETAPAGAVSSGSLLFTGQTPDISASPSSSVPEHTNITLICRYPGNDIVQQYQWFRNSADIAVIPTNGQINCDTFSVLSGNYSIVCPSNNEYHLIIENVTRWMEEDTWHCSVYTSSITASRQSSNISIRVQVPISSVDLTVPQVDTVNIIEDNEMTLQCEASPGLPGADIFWYYITSSSSNPVAITTGVSVSSTQRADKLRTAVSTLRYSPSRSNNGNIIHCWATNSDETMTSARRITLTVLYAPTVLQIQDQNVVENLNLDITCNITAGNPAEASFTWTKDTDSSWTQDGSRLLIGLVQKSDKGQYTCTASNAMIPTDGENETGTDTGSFEVIVLYPPTVRSLSSASVVEFQSLKVTCSATRGIPTPTFFRWTRTSDSSWSQDSAILSIPSVQRTEATEYTCTAWNVMVPTNGSPVNGTSAESFTLDVLYAPKVINLTDQSVVENNLFIETCSVVPGNPSEYEITWTSTFDSGWSVSGDVLSISSVDRGQAGAYTCTAQNTMVPTQGSRKDGTDSRTFDLDILYPPVAKPIADTDVLETNHLTVTCYSTPGNPSVTSYRWKRANDNNWAQTTQTLDIPVVLRGDAGQYSCTASNNMVPTTGGNVKGDDTTSFNLNVLFKASITGFSLTGETGDGPYTINENTVSIFQCGVESNPASQIIISKDGQDITSASNTKHLQHTKRFECLDAGRYTCVAYNEHNQNERPSRELELFVRCSPRPSETMNENMMVYMAVGDPVTLELSIISYPLPSFVWHRQRPGSSTWTRLFSGVTTSSTQSSLFIASLQVGDYGQYRLTATNNIGSYMQFFTIAAQGKPQVPTIIDVVPGTAVRVRWRPGFNGGSVQTFYIEYKSESAQTWTIMTVTDSTESIFNATIPDLSPGTTYMVRIFAINDIGKSETSVTKRFTVPATEEAPEEQNGPPVAIIAGAASAVVVIVVIAFIIIIIRKRRMGDGELRLRKKSKTNQRTSGDRDEIEANDATQHSTDDEGGGQMYVNGPQSGTRTSGDRDEIEANDATQHSTDDERDGQMYVNGPQPGTSLYTNGNMTPANTDPAYVNTTFQHPQESPKPPAVIPKPPFLRPQPESTNQKPEIISPKPQVLSPKPQVNIALNAIQEKAANLKKRTEADTPGDGNVQSSSYACGNTTPAITDSAYVNTTFQQPQESMYVNDAQGKKKPLLPPHAHKQKPSPQNAASQYVNC